MTFFSSVACVPVLWFRSFVFIVLLNFLYNRWCQYQQTPPLHYCPSDTRKCTRKKLITRRLFSIIIAFYFRSRRFRPGRNINSASAGIILHSILRWTFHYYFKRFTVGILIAFEWIVSNGLVKNGIMLKVQCTPFSNCSAVGELIVLTCSLILRTFNSTWMW